MSRNAKIDKINAYKKMLENKRLPPIKDEKNPTPKNPDDPTTWSVEEQIHGEFTAWAEKQLAVLLGEENPAPEFSSGFSEEQEEVLRQFADRMIEKAAAQPSSPAPKTKAAPLPEKSRTSNSGGYVPPKDAAPIGNKQREREAQLRAKQTQPRNQFLDELDRMDREAPDYE